MKRSCARKIHQNFHFQFFSDCLGRFRRQQAEEKCVQCSVQKKKEEKSNKICVSNEKMEKIWKFSKSAKCAKCVRNVCK